MQRALIAHVGFPKKRNSAIDPFSHNQLVLGTLMGLGLTAFVIFLGPLVLIQVATAVSVLLYIAGFFNQLIVTLASCIGRETPVEWITDDMEHPAATPGLITFTKAEIQSLTDSDLVMVTSIIPMFHEGDKKYDKKSGFLLKDGEFTTVAPHIEAISNMDYPPHLRDIIFALEEDDKETIAAVRRQIEAFNIQDISRVMIKPPAEVSVPDGNGRTKKIPTEFYPQTKPNACNWALKMARGLITVIWDAEDKPEPDQIKKAVAAFRKSPKEMVCVQAKLEYANSDTNFWTACFTAEYAKNFDVTLPGLSRLGLPIPLGGTSNYFKTEFLRKEGAWDSYNVTEDRDLGYWIAVRKKLVGIFDSVTWEEACSVRKSWIKQRSRWIKGTMVTYLVHMKNPIQLYRDLGFKQFLSFQMECGVNPLLLLISPIYWLTTAVYLVTGSHFIESLYPGPIFYLGLLCLLIGNLSFLMFNFVGCIRRKIYSKKVILYNLLAPLYWAFMSWAALIAFYQLVRKPHYWEKTEHGLDTKGVKALEPSLAQASAGGD